MDIQRKVDIGAYALLGVIGIIMLYLSSFLTFGMDEYVFYRLSLGLPTTYETSPDWIYVDNPSVLKENDPRGAERIYEVVQGTYTTPIYAHGPLAPVIMRPTIELVGAELVPSERDTEILRFFSIAVALTSFFLVYRLLRRRVGYYAILFAVPVMLTGRLLVGTMWFYWDVFMMFFLVLTLYLLERPNTPKWLPFLTACCMVNTKMFIGAAFLIPLMFKDKRFILCGFSILPWWLASWAVTGDFFFWFNYYFAQTGFHNEIYTRLGWWMDVWRLDFVLFLIATLGSLTLIRRYPVPVMFFVCTLLYGFGTGLGTNHLSAILYGGALVFPLLIADRVKLKWKEEVAV